MKTIPWVEVYKRKYGTDEDYDVIQSYPFPDAIFEDANEFVYSVSLSTLRNWLNLIEDKTLRECQLRRLSFIRDIWHPSDFMVVHFKDWKYS